MFFKACTLAFFLACLNPVSCMESTDKGFEFLIDQEISRLESLKYGVEYKSELYNLYSGSIRGLRFSKDTFKNTETINE